MTALMEDSGAGVAFLSRDGRILECNGEFCVFLGTGSEEGVVGTSLGQHLPSPIDGEHDRVRTDVVSDGRPCAIEGPFVHTRCRATYRPINDGDAALVLVVSHWPVDRGPFDGVRVHLIKPRPEDPVYHLTRREREVLALIAHGLTTEEIATRLRRAIKTVEGHRANLGTKLGSRNRVELARLAWLWGLAPIEQADPPSN